MLLKSTLVVHGYGEFYLRTDCFTGNTTCISNRNIRYMKRRHTKWRSMQKQWNRADGDPVTAAAKTSTSSKWSCLSNGTGHRPHDCATCARSSSEKQCEIKKV